MREELEDQLAGKDKVIGRTVREGQARRHSFVSYHLFSGLNMFGRFNWDLRHVRVAAVCDPTWREDGPLNHLGDDVDPDQLMVNNHHGDNPRANRWFI